MLRLSHILTTAALVAVCAAPASAATFEQLHSSDQNDGAFQGRRRHRVAQQLPARSGVHDRPRPGPGSALARRGRRRAAPRPVRVRSGCVCAQPGLRLARRARRRAAAGQPGLVCAQPGLRLARRDDAGGPASGADRGPRAAPRVLGGFDWGDAGIGAAGMFGLFAIAAGSALLLLTIRRRGQRLA